MICSRSPSFTKDQSVSPAVSLSRSSGYAPCSIGPVKTRLASASMRRTASRSPSLSEGADVVDVEGDRALGGGREAVAQGLDGETVAEVEMVGGAQGGDRVGAAGACTPEP